MKPLVAPITSDMRCPISGVPLFVWQGCYEDSWKGMIVPEAFAHPAKFSRSLIQRIINHGIYRGFWKPGDLIGDPFGGVALGGLVCGYSGINWVGVELEPRFVELGNQNILRHAPKWMMLNLASSVKLIQGDSRRFGEIVAADGIVTSPPFLGAHDGAVDNTSLNEGACKRPWLTHAKEQGGYGSAPGQIGSLSAGDLDAILTSPPYQGSQQVDNRAKPCSAMSSTWRKRQGEITDGEHPDQLANADSETYWQAMSEVYAQCLRALKPSGVLAVVIKDYIKDKQRVPLCDQTLRLLLHLGFQPVERVRAMLVKEHTEAGLFALHTKRTERKSFFRRLAEKKGSPRIDWEEVLFVRRAAA